MAPAHPKSGLVVIPKDLTASSLPETNPSLISFEAIELPVKNTDKIVPLYIAHDHNESSVVVEFVKFTHTHGSWITVPQDFALAPHFCSDGNLTFITKVDPLFAILIVMDCNSESAQPGVFQPLDVLCTTEEGRNLSNLSSKPQIALLCDSKVAGGESFYRLSKEKTVSWILRKHQLLSQHPRLNDQCAADILCQYLTQRWATLFKSALDIRKPIAQSIPGADSPADLAMSIMMDGAKDNSIATSLPQYDKKRKASQKRTTTLSKKKKDVVNKQVAKWWASRKTSANARTTSSRKKALRSSATK